MAGSRVPQLKLTLPGTQLKKRYPNQIPSCVEDPEKARGSDQRAGEEAWAPAHMSIEWWHALTEASELRCSRALMEENKLKKYGAHLDLMCVLCVD